MKLITEVNESIEYITEGEGPQKNLYLTGVFMQSEIQNKNGRLYPKPVMENALLKYIDTRLANKTSYGELGHPDKPKINEDKISHLIEKLEWNGNDVMGKARILATPMGNTARAIVEGGGRLGVSSRGLGTLKPNRAGLMEVQNDFFIATPADIVTDPSAPKALVNGIMEGIEWIYDEKNGAFYKQTVNEIKDEVHKTPIKRLDEAKLYSLFVKLMRTL